MCLPVFGVVVFAPPALWLGSDAPLNPSIAPPSPSASRPAGPRPGASSHSSLPQAPPQGGALNDTLTKCFILKQRCRGSAPSSLQRTLTYLKSTTWARPSLLTWIGHSALFQLRAMVLDLEVLILIPANSHSNCSSRKLCPVVPPWKPWTELALLQLQRLFSSAPTPSQRDLSQAEVIASALSTVGFGRYCLWPSGPDIQSARRPGSLLDLLSHSKCSIPMAQ